MRRKLKQKQRKNKVFLCFIVVLLLLPFFLVIFQTKVGFALNNGRNNEVSPAKYHFDRNYGAHDWVFDSAINMIYQDTNYRTKISSWLYDESLNIWFSDFEDKSDDDEWWNANSYAGTGLFNSEKSWRFARRYVTALYGTMIPDIGMPRAILNIPVNDEEASGENINNHPLLWCRTPGGKRGHSLFFLMDENTEKYVPSKLLVGDYDPRDRFKDLKSMGLAAEYATIAGLQALYYLNKMKDGEPAYKYEAAAICLGGMAHFIGDLANPLHTVLTIGHRPPEAQSTNHKSWDAYLDTFANWNDIGPGDPNWGEIDPREFFDEKNKGLEPIFPYQAAVNMAEITALALDYKGTHSAYDGEQLEMDWDNYVARNLCENPAECSCQLTTEMKMSCDTRAKELIMWAVYYTACAILWVLDLTSVEQRDTSNGGGEQAIEVPTGPKAPNQVKEWIMGNDKQDRSSKWVSERGLDSINFSQSMIILAPIMIVSLFAFVPLLREKPIPT